MITLKESIEIKATSARLREWLRNVDKHYKEWHPDHIRFVKVTGGLDVGDVFYFEEYLNGKLYKGRYRITKIEENRKGVVEFRGLSFLDRILGAQGSFTVESLGKVCLFTATHSLRCGWLISKLFMGLIKAMEKHMKEEGENLKRLLERRFL